MFIGCVEVKHGGGIHATFDKALNGALYILGGIVRIVVGRC